MATALYGQSGGTGLGDAIDLGRQTGPFDLRVSYNTSGLSDNYSCPRNTDPSGKDAYFRVELDSSYYVNVYNETDWLAWTNVHCLDLSGKEILHGAASHYANGYAQLALPAGTFHIVVETSASRYGETIPEGEVSLRFRSEPRRQGEDFSRPIDLGSFGEAFEIRRDQTDFVDYLLDYGLTGDWMTDEARRDIVYRFSLTVPMEVTLNNAGSGEGPYNARNTYRTTLMTAGMDSIDRAARYELMPGDYYIYTWCHQRGNPVNLVTNLSGTPLPEGSDSRWPISLGEHASGFNASASYDTRRSLRSQSNAKTGKEGYFSLTLNAPMEVTLDCLGSGVADTHLSVSDEDRKRVGENDDTGSGENPRQSRVSFPALPAGTYLITVDGATDGEVRLNASGRTLGEPGDLLITAIDIGSRAGGFTFSDTRNTAGGYTDAYRGTPANDVFYRLTLTAQMPVEISHGGSEVKETRMTLLASDGVTVLRSGEGYLDIPDMPAGTYYIVSEGESENGIITTTVTATGETGPLTMTESVPYTLAFTPTVASDDAATLGDGEARHEAQYYDAFGNPEQLVELGVSPYGAGLYTLQEYDALNREVRSWLPVTLEGEKGARANPDVLREAARSFAPYGSDGRPYSEKVYGNSALDEVLREYGPGEDWKRGERPVRTDRMTNRRGDGRLSARAYGVEGNSLTCSGEYPAGRLSVVRATDEDGNETYEFRDAALDRVVLSRQVNGDELHDTYTVYDGFGNVRFVLPPAAADALSAEGSWSGDGEVLKKYAYVYRYDDRNRMVYKRLPGAEPIYTVYDAADRPVFTQDGDRREKGEWTFNIVDAFNRTVLTGTCKNVLDYTANPLGESVVTAEWASATNALKGYAVTGVALTSPTVQAANYYDHYGFLGLNGIPNDATTAYGAVEGYGERYAGGCKGQLTGVWRASLGDGSLPAYDVSYYDNRYRMVQRRGINGSGERTATYTAYSFTGQPLRVKRTRGADTETLTYAYDNADRLLTVDYSLNGAAEERLVDNVYDEIGRLISERRNGNAKLKTDYAYNVRSWITGINGPLFTQTLRYQESFAGSEPRFNGNISCAQWKSGNSTARKGYRFAYDGLSRMTNAIYGEGDDMAANVDRFNEQITGYDKMGNILGLLRYGQISSTGYGLVDNLNLTYDGNQLLAVRDNATNGVYGNGMEFKDGANATVEYEYDANGNLTKDLNKNISDIEYNCLNLPSQVTFGNGNAIKYEYAADGTKLRAVHTVDGKTTTTDYRGNAVYENGELKMLLNEAGYVSFPDRKFHFYIKDHQGNVRVVADAEGNVEEVNDYYPFGGLMSSATANGFQPYKYNGKELDREAGLDLYDYGARFYDPAIGRFMTVDPQSDKLYPWSPYGYCLNNPVKLVDQDGELPVILIPILKGLAGGVIDFGVQMGLNMARGDDFSEAFNNVDWTSVGASAVSFAVETGFSTATKVAVQATAITSDAVMDYSIENKFDYSTFLGGNKSIGKTMTDAAASTLPGLGGDRLIKGFDKAISKDLSSKGAATLTKETKNAMRNAQKLVNSKQFKTGANVVESAVGGTAGKIVEELKEEKLRLEELEKLKKLNP